MNKEKVLKAWIEDIAKDISAGKCPHGIVEHIQKHATKDLDKHIKDGKMQRWAASMRNLLMIFEAMHNLNPSTDDMLERLMDHYNRNPLTRTPCPLEEDYMEQKIRLFKLSGI